MDYATLKSPADFVKMTRKELQGALKLLREKGYEVGPLNAKTETLLGVLTSICSPSPYEIPQDSTETPEEPQESLRVPQDSTETPEDPQESLGVPQEFLAELLVQQPETLTGPEARRSELSDTPQNLHEL